MRVLFAATPDIAVPTLRALASSSVSVGVLTNPPAPTGRGGKLTPSAVDAAALELGLEVYRADKLDAGLRETLEGRYDVLVSFAFGKIFGPKFLALFPGGGFNIHPSLLPRWRGPSPLSAAIAARDTTTGLTIQKLALQMDCGDVVYQSTRVLDGTETTASLTEWAAQEAPSALLEVLERLEKGTLTASPQDETLATYCRLVTKTDGRLDWGRSAQELDAQIRASNPWPGATTTWNGQPLTIWNSSAREEVSPRATDISPRGEFPPQGGVTQVREEVSQETSSGATPGRVLLLDKKDGILIKTGDGLLVARELQLPARKSLDYRSFVNGSPGLIGSLLGDTP